jgi:hypothetical protein
LSQTLRHGLTNIAEIFLLLLFVGKVLYRIKTSVVPVPIYKLELFCQ